jgi:hypothetical protein
MGRTHFTPGKLFGFDNFEFREKGAKNANKIAS